MTTNKHTVATDALQTLGTILTGDEKRDAIHLAVIPVVAYETMKPGERVRLTKKGEATIATVEEECVGIVDPFLYSKVVYGQRFWCVLNPRTITSLRHVWSHPAFPEEVPVPDAPVETDAVKAAAATIRDMAADLDTSVQHLMEGAAEFLRHGDYLCFGFDLDYEWDHAKFWQAYGVVTGGSEADAGFFFRCAC